MRAYAEKHPKVADNFRQLAATLDKAVDDLAITDETPAKTKIARMMRAWAQARRAWCDETRESLI
jgi:hypothetical protein